MATDTVFPSRRKRRSARLAETREQIFQLTGNWPDNKVKSPTPLCTLCKGLTIALYSLHSTEPRQKEQARKCENCDIIFPLIKKTVVIETYDY